MLDLNGEIGIVLYGGLFLFLILSISLIMFVYAYRKKQLVHEAEKTLLQKEFDMEIVKSHLEISEQTLKNVSREIHDNLGQRLTLVFHGLKENDETTEMKGVLKEVISELRDLSRSLHGNYITDMGLDLALERECQLVQSASKIDCLYIPPDNAMKLSPEQEIMLFRCAQEMLNNAVKYSGATQIQVALAVLDPENQTQLTVADNGCGFDTDNVVEGIGLKSLRERVALLKGNIAVTSSNQGTYFQIKLNHAITDGYPN